MGLFGGNRSITVGLNLNPAGVRAGAAVAKKEILDLARAGSEASIKHKRSYADLADGIGKAGLAVGAFVAVSVIATAKFDKSMSRAKAATQATASELTALRAVALKAGADTQFSATQAADAITEMAKAGVSVRDILGGGLAGTLALAAAGELEVARAAEIGATTMTQFGLSGRDLGHVADVLAAGAGKAQGSVEDLSQALKYVGPVSNSLGVSLEETAGTLALLAKNGIIGEQAGTAVRGMLISLTAPSKIAAKTMNELGISVYDAQGQFIGINGAAGELHQALSGLTEAQRNAALGTIFGNEQLTAATILYQGGATAVNKWTGEVTDAGFAVRQARDLMDNLAGDVEKLKGSLETAFISGGSGTTEGLRELTQAAEGAVNAFNAIPAPIQEGTVKVAAFTAVGLLAAAAALKLVSGAAHARQSMQELGVSAASSRGTLIGLARAFGVVAVAVPIAAEGFDKLNEATTRSAPGIKETTNALLDFSKGAQASGAIADLFGGDLSGIKDTAGAMEGLSGKFLKLGDQAGKVVLPLRAIGKPLEEQRAGLESVDQALSDLVSAGHADQAAAAFRRTGLTLAENKDLFPQYAEALEGVKTESKAAAGASGAFTHGVKDTGAAAIEAANAMDSLVDSTQAYSNLILTQRGDARGYEAALDALTDSIKENGRSLDITTEKGRANQEALDNIVASGQSYAESTLRQTGSGEKFRAVLTRTRADLLSAAQRFGMTKAQAEAYADRVLKIPSVAETNVKLNGIAGANIAIERFIERLAWVNGRVVNVRVSANAANVREGRTASIPSRNEPPRNARALGGILPGPPSRRDNMVIAAASGEFVVNSAQTARHRPLLEAINTGALKGFATGGFVSSPFGTSDVQQRYQSLIPQPITPQQYAAAMKAAADAQGRAANAAASLRKAERELSQARRSGSAEKIRDAEDRLDRARRSSAAARRAEAAAEAKAADATRRKNAGRGFNLGLYINALGQTTKQAESYRRNLSAVSRRGGSDLAAALEAMGADGAPLIAALVRASPAQFKRVANLLRRLDPSAFGGGQKVTRFASGGIAPATMGGWRVFGEAGADEAFIPLGQSNQPRARALTADVAGRLGGQVTWSSHRVVPGATGVSAAPSAAVTGGGGVSMNVGTVQLLRGGPEDVANDVMFRVRQLGG